MIYRSATLVRRRIAIGMLAAMLVWPLLHHVLVRTVDLDPWSFFGWAMYSAPNLRVNVRAARVDDRTGALDWNSVSPRAWRWLVEYGVETERWGRWVRPDAVARRIFESQPELSRLVIRVRRFGIDRESARLVARDTDYHYASKASSQTSPGSRPEVPSAP